MIVRVSDPATGMSVTYWHVKDEDADDTREKALKELYHRKEQLAHIPVVNRR